MSDRFAEIVRSIAETDDVIAFHERKEGGVFFEVSCGEGRSQVVMAKLVEADDEVMVHMMSEIGPADPALYEEMLVRNLGLVYTRLALIENEGARNFALVYAYPFEELELVEFARAFGEMAFMADGIERDLYGVDQS